MPAAVRPLTPQHCSIVDRYVVRMQGKPLLCTTTTLEEEAFYSSYMSPSANSVKDRRSAYAEIKARLDPTDRFPKTHDKVVADVY